MNSQIDIDIQQIKELLDEAVKFKISSPEYSDRRLMEASNLIYSTIISSSAQKSIRKIDDLPLASVVRIITFNPLNPFAYGPIVSDAQTIVGKQVDKNQELSDLSRQITRWIKICKRFKRMDLTLRYQQMITHDAQEILRIIKNNEKEHKHMKQIPTVSLEEMLRVGSVYGETALESDIFGTVKDASVKATLTRTLKEAELSHNQANSVSKSNPDEAIKLYKSAIQGYLSVSSSFNVAGKNTVKRAVLATVAGAALSGILTKALSRDIKWRGKQEAKHDKKVIKDGDINKASKKHLRSKVNKEYRNTKHAANQIKLSRDEKWAAGALVGGGGAVAYNQTQIHKAVKYLSDKIKQCVASLKSLGEEDWVQNFMSTADAAVESFTVAFEADIGMPEGLSPVAKRLYMKAYEEIEEELGDVDDGMEDAPEVDDNPTAGALDVDDAIEALFI